MKIKEMTSKTSLEVQDTDLLIIEDDEDTKSISVAAFRDFLNSSIEVNIDKKVKTAINETLDSLITAIESCKYSFISTKSYMINTWIDSTSGDIQIAILDHDTNKWLTAQELVDMTEPNQDGEATRIFSIQLKVSGAYQTAVSFSIRDFNTEYTNAHDINAWLPDDNVGFIRANFEELTQNEIANIVYDDIKLLFPSSEEFQYVFETNANSFSNTIAYEEEIPSES